MDEKCSGRNANRRESLPCYEECSSNQSCTSFLSWDFVETHGEDTPALAIPRNLEEQEKSLVEDMLNILIGFEGRFIKVNPILGSDRRTFRISSTIHRPFLGMIKRLLPAASDYSEIARFVERSVELSAGRVNQALGCAFSYDLTDYMDTVLELEHQQFLDLNIIWSHIHTGMNKLHIMAQICTFIRKENARGGCTLSILHSCTSNSLADPEAQGICLQWTRIACEPFFESLEIWLTTGRVFDPYDEFMIVEKIDRDTSLKIDWDHKFQIRKTHTPQFLENVASTILNAGIYMFCISKTLNDFPKVCFSELSNSHRALLGHLVYDTIDFVYINGIKRALNKSNAILRQLFDLNIESFNANDFANIILSESFEGDSHTLRKLEFVKSVFCIQYGDLFYNIFESCEAELLKPAKKDNFYSLPKLVKLSIMNSSVGAKENEKFCTDIDVELERGTLSWQIDSLLNVKSPRDSTQEQTLLEAIALKSNVTWPLKMILDTRSMKFYQMIFRHIFYIKYVYKRLTASKFSGTRRKHALKYSMIIFLQICLTYMTVETVETKWETFRSNYCNAVHVSDLVKEHKKYLFDVLTACMLTSTHMFDQLRKVLDVCLKFVEIGASDCEKEFETALVALIELADADYRWTSFSRILIPIFKNINAIALLNTDNTSINGDVQSTISIERSFQSLDIK